MKKMIAAFMVFAFTMMICSVSSGYDKSPPGTEQTVKKSSEIFQIDQNEFQMIQPIAYASVQLTVTKAACGHQDFAESTAIINAPAFAVEDATLFYIFNDKTKTRDNIRKAKYAEIKYSMAGWRL